VRIEHAIQAHDAQTLLDRCVDSGDPTSSFCSNITRIPAGDINYFQDQIENLGVIETQGFDFGIDWIGTKTAWGHPTANWQTTYVDYYRAIDAASNLPEPNAVGIEVNDSSIPRWRSNLTLSWVTPSVTAGWTIRYIGAVHEYCSAAAGFAICDNNVFVQTQSGPEATSASTHKMGAVAYDDLHGSWKLPIAVDTTLTAGVNNVFDQGAPVCLSCSLNGYDASTYDLPGRFGYVEANVKF